MAEPIWEVRWIQFNEGESFEDVSDALANVAAGWEPFAAMPNRKEGQGWILLLKRRVVEE